MMEETKNKKGNVSIESLLSSPESPDSSRGISAALDGCPKARINPLHTKNDLNAVHQDVPTNKHSYWRGRGVWGRSSESPNSSNQIMDPSRTVIDTAAPFESVKAAVNMFGGNVDWKAQRDLSKERSRNFEQELEKAEQDIPLYQKQSKAAGDAKASVLQELEITKKQAEELRLQVEKALTEETQARQDSALAQLRVKEMEQGIGNEDSVATKAQVEVARTRYLEAEDELKSVEAEVDALKKEYDQLIKGKDITAKKTDEAVRDSNEVEKRVEELTIELIIVKEALVSAQESHLNAEEQRLNAFIENEKETHSWQQQLRQSQEDLQFLEDQLSVVNDLKLKLNTATALLTSLKVELAAYVDTKLSQEAEIVREERQKLAQIGTREALTAAKKELEEVNASIEKVKDEVNCLRIAATSLESELDVETSSLVSLKRKEEMSAMTVLSLEVMLEKNQSEQEEVQAKQKRSCEEMRELPNELLEKTEESDQAKSQAHSACQELTKAMEEAELSKAIASTMELRLEAVFKEIEAAKASEKLALEAIKAMQESEEATTKDGNESSPDAVTIPLEEYYALSKRANEAERLANERVVAAVGQIKDAKKIESMIREKLEAAYKEIKVRKVALRDATEKAEKAKEGKLKMEQELRDWRAESEQRRKANESAASSNGQSKSVHYYWKSFDDSKDLNNTNPAAITLRVNSTPNPKRHYSASEVDASMPELRPRRKKSFFPRIVMFLARKKAHSLK